MSEQRKVVLHQSFVRPNLLAGAERKLVLLNGIISFALIFGIGSIQGVVLGLILLTVVHSALVLLANRDSQFSDVYARHITYQPYYPARAAYSAPAPIIKYWSV